MRTEKTLFRIAATLAVAAFLALPAAAQPASFTTYVSLGDSLTMGVMDACVVEHGQRDSYPAIIARQAGVSAFEQPLIKEHGLGPCMYLKSLLSPTGTPSPVFGYWPNDGVPLKPPPSWPDNNNLGIDGFKIHDVVSTNPTTLNDYPAAYLTLHGNGTALDQAKAKKPTFVTIWIGANEFYPAITSATAIECPDPRVPGCTLTAMSSVNADLDTIFSTLKAAQGGTGKGVVLSMADPLIPFVTTVSPILGINPATSAPIYALYDAKSSGGCPGGLPACPVPAGSYLTLVAGQYLTAGYGVPCAILAPTDPKQANCNKPLPDIYSVNPSTGAVSPGVVLTPTEFEKIRKKAQDVNASIQAKATAAGYKVFDMYAWWNDILAHGRSYGGMTVTASFLGGIVSYDGAHLTSTGYAILADDLIKFINANYGNSLPEVDMYPFLFNGNTSPGGYPAPPAAASSLGALTNEEAIEWAAAVFTPDTWLQNLRSFFPDVSSRQRARVSPEIEPAWDGPEAPRRVPDRVN